MNRLICSVVLCVSGFTAVAQPTAPNPVAAGPPEISFEKIRHDFGIAPPGPNKVAFRFKNTGASPLEIVSVTPGCPGCTHVLEYDKNVGPGKEGNIAIELNTTGMRGRIEKTVLVASNDPKNHNVTLTLAVDVEMELAILPSDNVWLGRLRPGSATNHFLEIKSSLAGPLRIENLQSAAPWLAARLLSTTTNSARMEIATRPPIPYGSHRVHVTFHTQYPKYSNVVVTVSAQVPAIIAVIPATLVFKKGESRTLGAILTRNDGKDFHIAGIENPSPALRIAVSTNSPGRSYRINATYNATNDPAPGNGTIEVLTDEPEWPKVGLSFEFR